MSTKFQCFSCKYTIYDECTKRQDILKHLTFPRYTHTNEASPTCIVPIQGANTQVFLAAGADSNGDLSKQTALYFDVMKPAKTNAAVSFSCCSPLESPHKYNLAPSTWINHFSTTLGK